MSREGRFYVWRSVSQSYFSRYKPVIPPNGAALPFKIVDGVKVFHLIAGEVDHEFDPALRAKCWEYNGRVNSTIIEAVDWPGIWRSSL
jgi:hypothetical protein